MKMQKGLDQQYDNYFKEGRVDEEQLRESIRENYAKILKCKN